VARKRVRRMRFIIRASATLALAMGGLVFLPSGRPKAQLPKAQIPPHELASSSFIPSLDLVGADGSLYTLNATNFGTPFSYGITGLSGSHPLAAPIVGIASNPSGGYWMVGADGGVFSFGNAGYYGNTYSLGLTGLSGSHPLAAPIVGIASTPHGHGYWLVAADGGVFAFGSARFYGNTYTIGLTGLSGSHPLAAPIVGIAPTPDGGGYWLVAKDGGVFAFGDARYYGNTYSLGLTGLSGSHPLAAPIVGIARTPDGGGYWLVAADGGVFAFGDANFYGNTYTVGLTGLSGSHPLAAPIVGIAPTPDGGGYWLIGADGGVFAFGDAPFIGSAVPDHPSAQVVGGAFDPTPPYTVFGYDLNNYNCSVLPSQQTELGLTETTGYPFYEGWSSTSSSPSPCFQSAATVAGNQTQLFIFEGSTSTGNPITPPLVIGSYPPASSAANTAAYQMYVHSSGSSSPGANFTYGFDEAYYAYYWASNQLPGSPILHNTWWLDVETNPGSQWQANTTANYDTILGSLAALEQLGVQQAGVYSTYYQWTQITGGDSPLPPNTPIWMADPGITTDQAIQVCQGQGTNGYQPFGGGTVQVIQYYWGGGSGYPVLPDTSVSQDMLC
jgi:hypothetical protein